MIETPLESLLTLLHSESNLFLTGGAGVGKTTMTRAVISHFESEAKKVAKLASTGMAATLIGGQTLHSFFDLGICNDVDDLERQGKSHLKKKIHKLIGSMDLIIIDEISMVSASLFEMIRLRLLQAEYQGVIMVVGDFLQLPPVVRGFGEVMFAFESESWERFAFKTITLTEVYRTEDRDFIKILNAVRFSEVGEYEHYYLHQLIKPIPEEVIKHTFLYGKNISASRHNEEQLSFIESDERSYDAQIVRHDKSAKDKEIERFFDDARIEKKMRLKVGAPVLFTRNAWNYFNGERGTLIKMDETALHVRKADGIIVKLETVAMSKSVWKEKTIKGKKELVETPLFSIYQFPLQLAFAITIHKSQGMSLEDLIIDTTEIFAPSQFYVALSRTVSPHRLILKQPLKDWKYLAFVNEKALKFVREGLE
ncbi:MAG: AAA family ATPase [Campylobacterota bacterium]|nr:AAA family ATPase [Campylobacterota bacterium]